MRLTNKSDSLGYTRKFEDPDIIRKITHKLGKLEDFEEELRIELIPFLSQLAEAMEQLKKNGLKLKAVNFQAKGKKYKLEELE